MSPRTRPSRHRRSRTRPRQPSDDRHHPPRRTPADPPPLDSSAPPNRPGIRRGTAAWQASRDDDLDPIAVLQPRERREQVLIVCLHELGLRATVEVGPGRGSPPTTVITRRVELPLIRLRSIRPLLQIGQESVAEPRRGKHLGEDRRNANRDRSFAAFLLEAIEEPEDRERALGRGLVEPRFPVRPTTMAEDPR